MTEKRSSLVVGVGPVEGLGAALAMRFAREGLHSYVAGRTESDLKKVVEAIEKQGGSAEAIVCDATDQASVTALFDKIGAADAPLDLVVYNAGNNQFRPLLEMDQEFFEGLWRVCALGGFFVGQAAARQMIERGQGTILFTGATAATRSRPPFTAFASAKAAERALAHGMAREFGPQGIHVAHVVVDGIIGGEKVAGRFPDFYKQLGEDGVLNIDAMADVYWTLHQQHKTTWSLEVDIRPYKENF